jgi:hypothetical protein
MKKTRGQKSRATVPLRPRNTLSRISGNYPAYNIWEYLVQRLWVIATMKTWDYHDWKIS